MPLATPLLEARLSGLTLHRQGKVRDIYEFDDVLLMVATDRISAFDCVLGSGIPDKGKVLTQLSAFWFDKTRDIVANHVVETNVRRFPAQLQSHAALLSGRSMLVRKTTPVPIECVARGYLSGSGWTDYCATGAVCGVQLPSGLQQSDRLPEPIFTPASKATSGHDMNISEAEAAALIGQPLLDQLRSLTMALYARGAAHADGCGIMLADTKFEFGLTADDRILLIDEVMTPDSSRYWPKDEYHAGQAQPSFDKQFVRDYLEEIHWNKQPPAPSLPEDVVTGTRAKYVEAFRRLTGKDLD